MAIATILFVGGALGCGSDTNPSHADDDVGPTLDGTDDTMHDDAPSEDVVDVSQPDVGPPPADADRDDPDSDLVVPPSCVSLTPLRLWNVEPSAVAMLFTAEDCATGAIFSTFRQSDFEIREDGRTLSSEAVPRILPSTGLRVHVSLLLDLSSSTGPVLGDLQEGARLLVRELLETQSLENVYVSLQLFDGAPDLTTWELPTRDVRRLIDRIDALSSYAGSDPSSTNLYGATRLGVEWLQSYQREVMERNHHGVVTTGYLILFTDGGDTSGRVPAEEARDVVVRARSFDPNAASPADPEPDDHAAVWDANELSCRHCHEILVLGHEWESTWEEHMQLVGACEALAPTRCEDFESWWGGVLKRAPGSVAPATVRTLAVGLRGEDYDRAALVELMGGASWVLESDLAQLPETFRGVAREVANRVRGTYLLAYCSPARAGEHEVALQVRGADSNTLGFRFRADGFTGGCSARFFEDACLGRTCGGFNCGACDDATEVCIGPESGVCTNACLHQGLCAGNFVRSPFGHESECAPSADATECGSMCVDVRTSTTHCGACNLSCLASGSQCVDGICTCSGSDSLCANQCVDLRSDSNNCGDCGIRCTAPAVGCVDGVCRCSNGNAACGGACVDTNTSATHCGRCDRTCPAGVNCTSGRCICGGTDCSGVLCEASRCLSVRQFVGEGEVGLCVELSDDSIRCFGYDNRTTGILGPNWVATGLTELPIAVVLPSVRNVRAMAITGYQYGCALHTNGTVRCWGQGFPASDTGGATPASAEGRLVDGLTDVVSLTTHGPWEYETYTDVLCTLHANDRIRCRSARPGLLAQFHAPGAVEILFVGSENLCVRYDNDSVRCGQFPPDRFGPDEPPFDEPLPDPFEPGVPKSDEPPTILLHSMLGFTQPLPIEPVESIVGTFYGEHACALLRDRTVRCWGSHDSGQLGVGSSNPAVGPVQPLDLGPVVQLAAHRYGTCALLEDGTVQCWGSHEVKLFGRPRGYSTVPAAVEGGVGFTSIAPYRLGLCGITSSGAVSCIGSLYMPFDRPWRPRWTITGP